MWNRKKEEETQSKPAGVQSTNPGAPAQNNQEVSNINMASAPLRNYEPTGSPNSAAIGKAVMVKGQIFSREDLLIDGEVEGTVEAQEHRVTVGPNGKVQASVKAREIVVLGMIQGNVEAAEKIDIRKDAKLVGDIKTSRIVIEDGAYFKGSIDIVKVENKKQASPAVTSAAAPVSGAGPAQAAPLAAAGAGDLRK